MRKAANIHDYGECCHVPTRCRVGCSAYTHLVRGGFLMLQPTGKDDARPKMLDPTHTHLVRGGSLMLQPAGRVGEGTQPASGGSGLGSSINDPPLTRWVCARLGTQPASGGSGVGSSIKDPPLTRWVCAKSDALPSDSTARCGAKRPGESSRLRVFVAKSCPSLILDIAAR